MPFVIAMAVGIGLVSWGVALRVRNPDGGRYHDVERTGNPSVDLSLMAAIPNSSGVAHLLIGIVVLVTALATLVVA